MESVRRKSLSPDGNQLIARANQKSIPLLWDRYESQLPLDGFAANGLTCHECLNGPCRINPFGDEPRQGICGADRPQVVLNSIFQSVKKGVLDSIQQLGLSAAMEKVSEAMILPNPHFADKNYLKISVRNLLKLGKIQYQLSEQAAKIISQKINPPSSQSYLDLNKGANVFLERGASISLVDTLLQAFQKQKTDLRLLVGEGSEHLRKWGAYVISLGHPELLLLTGGIDAFVTHGMGREPYLVDLAGQLGIEVFRAGIEPGRMPVLATSIARKAWQAFQMRLKSGEDPRPLLLRLPGERNTNKLFKKAKKVEALLKAKKLKGAVILIREGNAKQTFFERTGTIIEKLLKEDVLVFVGGGLFACQPILENLLKPETGKNLRDLLEELQESSPLFGLGSAYELSRVIEFLSSLDGRRGLRGSRILVSFPEINHWSSIALSFGFLSWGIPVQIGTPLPFWGSPELTEVFLKELKKISGAEFLIAPSLPGPEEQAEELLRKL
ncbi:MAG: hypothetical protein KKH04_20370 [Proteobacteria bacterium]|nr:hypothetical protein [Pseudomonadota bacterium]